jgi:hypothetical protein
MTQETKNMIAIIDNFSVLQTHFVFSCIFLQRIFSYALEMDTSNFLIFTPI